MNKLENFEFWEKYYLDQMEFMLLKDKDKMINALNSKDEIKNDWIEIYNKKSCDIDRGAERVYFWLLNQLGFPNSTPIGSDLLYETANAFLHIDVKTTSYFTILNGKQVLNTGDFKGLVSIGKNQTSYKYIDENNIEHEANLPFIYKSKNKLCLTYIIHLIYDKEKDGNLKILALLLICIPNGALHDVYGNEICGGSKNKNEAFRYRYRENPYFQLLKNKPLRLKILYKDSLIDLENIIGFKI
ncbi:MAG TPA: hypothetical protein PLC04_09240 [Candidatus Kapabacteria bacterium]|nr:hypothetical protein [Candidatus Kapabacteria bacterium]